MTSTITATTDLDTRAFSRADARAAGITVQRLLGRDFQRIMYDRYISSAVVACQST